MNTQAPAKPYLSDSGLLQVHSMFLTIQGEGPLAGTPAIFIRLFGCNLQCLMCDTDYTSNCDTLTIDDVLDFVLENGLSVPLVVITGGEPFRQNITPLCVLLLHHGYAVQVETNGTLPPSDNLPDDVMIVCSPKTGSVNHLLQDRIFAYKYVLHADHTDALGLPASVLQHHAKPHVAKPHVGFKGDIFLTPLDSGDPEENKRHLENTIDSCLTFGYRLCIQLHKIIGLE